MAVSFDSPALAQRGKYKTLGYRSCGTEQGACHQSDGVWWKGDPHFGTVQSLKRKKQRSVRIATAYGLAPGSYLKGNSKCAECHGEVVGGREGKNINTGVSCENCHGPAGPKGVGYYEVHQEGSVPKDPLSTARPGYQKALQVGMLQLRDTGIRAKTCVQCHQINDKKLLEADHPTGEGFDYVRAIRNQISKHWDYAVRPVDVDAGIFASAVAARPIPSFTVKVAAPAQVVAAAGVARTDTVFIYVDPEVPPWLNPGTNISISPFAPGLSNDAPVDSILIAVKNYIEYVHEQLRRGK